mmetsp:Transcript_7296/g.22973  ORF Transcript_7296/g.22973 Transcript_7296/m.22973 type:complete len:202 (-) Transcript_7296:1539-2144(-)
MNACSGAWSFGLSTVPLEGVLENVGVPVGVSPMDQLCVWRTRTTCTWPSALEADMRALAVSSSCTCLWNRTICWYRQNTTTQRHKATVELPTTVARKKVLSPASESVLSVRGTFVSVRKVYVRTGRPAKALPWESVTLPDGREMEYSAPGSRYPAKFTRRVSAFTSILSELSASWTSALCWEFWPRAASASVPWTALSPSR